MHPRPQSVETVLGNTVDLTNTVSGERLFDPLSDDVNISVVIPVHNGGEAFRRCLESIQSLQTPPYELIVVIDGCTDESHQLAQQAGAQIKCLPFPHGPAYARNLGASMANGHILYFVDADVTLYPDNLCKVKAMFAMDTTLTAVIGSYDDTPEASNFASQYRNLLHHFVHQTAYEDASTFWGACGVIRRQAFLNIGGFNERYRFPSIEDIELGYRLKAKGFKIRLCKDLQVKHLKHWTFRSILLTDIFNRALPWTILLLQQQHVPNDLNLKTSCRLSVVAVYTVLVLLLVGLYYPNLVVHIIWPSLVLISLNFSVYQFFYRKRGLSFALRVIPWHWLFYLYSGFAFGVGICGVCLFPNRLALLTGQHDRTSVIQALLKKLG